MTADELELAVWKWAVTYSGIITTPDVIQALMAIDPDDLTDEQKAQLTTIGNTVIWAHANGPRPELPYVTLHIIGDIDQGLPYSSQISGITQQVPNGKQKIHYIEDITVSVQVYGNTSSQIIRTLKESVKIEDTRIFLNNLGLAFRDFGTIRHVDSVLADSWEERRVADVKFGLGSTLEATPGWIEKVDITQN